jgi:hypothetical protein
MNQTPASSLVEHDLIRKPESTSRDRALVEVAARRLMPPGRSSRYFFNSEQVLLSSGVKAWSAGMVATSL